MKMEEAREKRTNRIVDAMELWLLHMEEGIDPLGFECRDCGVQVRACNYEEIDASKGRPYFAVERTHKKGCFVAALPELRKRARKERITPPGGFPPGCFPDRLVL